VSKFFVYYDDEGNILSITNENRAQGKYLEVEEEEVKDFLNGSKSFTQFKIHSLTSGNKGIKLASETTDLVYKDFCFVSPNEEGEVNVTHNSNTNSWEIKLNSKLVPTKMEFFICKNEDVNFLIRTFVVDKKFNVVNFESNLEKNINSLIVLTKKVYNSYGLKNV
jgi:hypothetical protein